MCHDKCIIFCSLNHVEHHLCLFWAIFYYNIPLPLVVTIQRSYGKTPFLSSVNYNVYLIHVGHLYHSYLQKFHDLSHIFPVCPLFIPYIATIQNNDSTQAVASSTTLQASTSCWSSIPMPGPGQRSLRSISACPRDDNQDSHVGTCFIYTGYDIYIYKYTYRYMDIYIYTYLLISDISNRPIYLSICLPVCLSDLVWSGLV